MKNLNPQDFEIGFASAILMVFVIGWWGVPLALSCALLWAIGGTYDKPIRRFGIPTLLFVDVAHFNGHQAWHWAALVIGIAILHIGDGFPDHRPETASEGSLLGQWVEKIVKPADQKEADQAGTLTKWLIPVIFQLSLIPYWLVR